MTRLSSKVFALILSFAMVLTGTIWLGPVNAYAATTVDEYTYVANVVDEEGDPVEGVEVGFYKDGEAITKAGFDANFNYVNMPVTKTSDSSGEISITVGAYSSNGIDSSCAGKTIEVRVVSDAYTCEQTHTFTLSDSVSITDIDGTALSYGMSPATITVKTGSGEEPAEKPAIADIEIDTTSGSDEEQPAAGGVYVWFIMGDLDADFSELTAEDFWMEVKAGEGAWTKSDAAVSFELGANDDEGLVTATVPDNNESVVKQWRFGYAGECAVVPAITQAAAENTSWDEACFTYSDDNTTITGLSDKGKELLKTDTDMVLPDTHEGVDITAIGPGTNNLGTFGFKDGDTTYEPTGAVLPKKLETIGNFAFSAYWEKDSNNKNDQYGVTSIVFPETLTSIGMSAFSNAPIKEVVFPDSLTTLGSGAFTGNDANKVKIKSVKLTK